MLISNDSFRNFVVNRSDIDLILVPLLKMLYQEKDLEQNYHFITTILITCLIMSQDATFCETSHRRLFLAQVPWYREFTIQNISDGVKGFEFEGGIIKFYKNGNNFTPPIQNKTNRFFWGRVAFFFE